MNAVYENKENNFVCAQPEQSELDFAADKSSPYVTLGANCHH